MTGGRWDERRAAHERRRRFVNPEPVGLARPLSATPIPARITTALDATGLYGPEVDEQLGGVEPMVDEWEEGKRTPTREQMEALAELTGFTADFFYMPLAPGERTGGIWLCQRSGPGKGCQFIEPKPGPSDAPVINLHPDTLF